MAKPGDRTTLAGASVPPLVATVDIENATLAGPSGLPAVATVAPNNSTLAGTSKTPAVATVAVNTSVQPGQETDLVGQPDARPSPHVQKTHRQS